MGGKQAEKEPREVENKTSEIKKIQWEHEGQMVVRGAETAASPDGLMLLHFIFWQMTHGAGGKKCNYSRIIYYQRLFLDSLLLVENCRLTTENTFFRRLSIWQKQTSNQHLQLAGYVHLPPVAHPQFHMHLSFLEFLHDEVNSSFHILMRMSHWSFF